jgi:tetratricopeptide (TPR) repeat protein
MRRDLGLIFLLLLFVFVVFCPALSFEFINFDDNDYLFANPFVKAGLSWDGLLWAMQTNHGGHWHPLTWLGHMGVASLAGMDPTWHHAVNVILHTLNAVLVYHIFIRLGLFRSIAFVTAIIWAVHPLRIESVVWAAQLKDVLSEFFVFGALLVYVARKRVDWPSTILISTLFLLSLLAKPTGILLPAIFVMADWWRGREFFKASDLLKSIKAQFPLIITCLVFSAAFIWAQASAGGLRDLNEVTFAARLEAWPVSVMAYLGKFFWPLDLAFFYPRRILMPGTVAGLACGLLAIFALSYSCFRRAPEVAFGLLWLVLATLPMSGLLAVGGQAYADRWTYLGHVGLAFSVGFLAQRFHGKSRLWCLWGMVAMLVIATRYEMQFWHDTKSLMNRALISVPDNFMAHTNLASAYLESGELELASISAEEAVRLNPTYPEALNNLGVVRARQHRLLEARDLFTRAIKIRPGFPVVSQNLALIEQDLQRSR